jgi:putative acetyltransferase
MEPLIRKIKKEDNPLLVEIITPIVIHEYKGNPKTTIVGDPTLHTMFENYQGERAVYYVAELDGKVVGGCGIRQLDGSEENICELQRMFIAKSARGIGIGKQLMQRCVADAVKFLQKNAYS